jgi:Peptidase family M28
VDAASAHLARLGAMSRPTGSAAASEARSYCAQVLRDLSFTVVERPFEYSKFPGAYATPLAGVLVPIFGLGLLFVPEAPRAFGISLLIAAMLAGLAFRFVGGRGVLDLRVTRHRGVNLEAVRGNEPPTVWLVAHVDSKWQPVSMIVRVLGVIGSAIGLIALSLLAVVPSVAPRAVAIAALVVCCVGAIPLMLSYVGSRNHGTLDNASGVAAVLEAAQMLEPGGRVGVLITDAEELALAGARAWARAKQPGIALNCDSLDDSGPLTVMHGSPAPRSILSALDRTARANGERLRVLRLIPGILTDHVALADAGWQTLTLSRGTARTLQRIHTTRDTLATMRGSGIAGAARVLAQTATELC